jgi:hypothetical protein
MNRYFPFGLAALLYAMFGNALGAPVDATETRNVDARVVRIKLDGVVDLKLRYGPVPTLVLTGEQRWLDKVTTVQNGDMLSIDTEGHGFRMGRHPSLLAELTLPNLREVTSESLGKTDISGFTGDELHLALDGAGAMKVACNYRVVTAVLGGLGSMNIQGVTTDGIDLSLRGAGYVTLAGHSKWLKASLGGLGGLDAQQLEVDSVDLELSGLGNARVTARQSAKLNLSGMGSVTVYGKPAERTVSVDGLGHVKWK